MAITSVLILFINLVTFGPVITEFARIVKKLTFGTAAGIDQH